MKLFLCSHFSSVGSLIKEEIENRLSGKLPSSAGRGALPDGRRGVGTAPREPAHLAGIPQQPRVALHTFGREGALPGNRAA